PENSQNGSTEVKSAVSPATAEPALQPHGDQPHDDQRRDHQQHNMPEVEAYTQTSPSDIKQYIKAAAEATERSRRVLIILITASVLALVAVWNSRQASWFNERYRLINAASMLFDEKNQRRSLQDPEVVKLRQNDASGLYERAEEYLRYRNINDRGILKNTLDTLNAQRAEHVSTVRMPFFGVGFDVNDIGLFAGFTFAVVLLWFRFSLLREVNNLRLTFFEARKQDKAKGESGRHEQLQFCYDLLAMRQVLTTPKMLPQDETDTFLGRPRQIFWFVISKLLFLLPLGVQFLVMRNDKNSEHIGRMISPHNTQLVMRASWLLLLSIVLLLALCYQLVMKAQMTWRDAARELGLK
ncbi:MAG TPA: hypothetical protein VJT82_00540, partial [Pyrinomonadaceae bacterium]|nr:hypothetical protein [Pyrinomonadaceae bacterium]